jgi:hypothetical protein
MRHGGQLRHGPLRAVRLRGEGSRCHVCFGQSLGERRFGYAELDNSGTQAMMLSLFLSSTAVLIQLITFWKANRYPARTGRFDELNGFYKAWRAANHASISVIPQLP